MLPKRKLFIPKQILAPKGVLLKNHDDGFAQEIFAKYNVLRNDLAAWFELFYKVDGLYEDYERADIGQLLINVRMQLQIQEESNKSSISILGQQALTSFNKQLENTVKTVYSSAGHQSIKYLKEKLLKTNLLNRMLFKNAFYYKSINPYHAFQRDFKNELSLNLNAIAAETNLGNVLNFPTRAGYGLGNFFSFLTRAESSYGSTFSFLTRAESSFGNVLNFLTRAESSFGNVLNFPTSASYGLGNILSFPTRAKYGLGNILSFLTKTESSLGGVLSFPARFEINKNRKAINEYRRAINAFYYKSINPYHAFHGDFGNELSLNSNAIAAESSFGSVFSFLTRAEYGLGNDLSFSTRVASSFGSTFSFLIRAASSLRNFFSFLTRTESSLGSILYHVFNGDFKNVFSLNFNAVTTAPGLGNVRIPYNSEMVIGKNINSFYFKNMNYNSAIYPIVNINGADELYSQGNYGENYESIINMNPYNFRNYYHIYYPKLSSYIGSGYKMAYIQGESIKEFSSVIHDKIVSGLRHGLPEVLRSAYRSGVFGVNRTKRKQKRVMDSETKEFWHNMTYNIIQGFRKELESKTNYFFTNYIDKRAYGLSPFFENEDENEESTQGNWTLQETLTHNIHTSFAHLGGRESKRITPYSMYNLKKTYPDIYNMLTFAGLLPTLYVQKHTRETAMGLLSKSIHQYYIGNRNLTVRAYDLLRNKLETEEKSFVWSEAMYNLTTMEFNNVRKSRRSSRYMEEIQALKTQVVNIEKQTLQSVHTSNVNVNGLVERIYKELEQKIKVDRVRRGY